MIDLNMVIFISTDDNDFVSEWGTSSLGESSISVVVPEDHGVLSNPFVYQYVDGALVYSEERKQELIDIRSNRPLSEVEVLRAQVEELKETQKQSDLAMMEMATMLFL